MSSTLLIINDAAAVAANYTEVKAGKFGYVKNGAVVGSLTAGDKNVSFSLDDDTTVEVDTGELISIESFAASAGTAHAAAVDYTGQTLPSEISLKLIETTIGTQATPVKTLYGADLAGLTAAINAEGADVNSEFYEYTAALATNTITITAPKNRHFRVAAKAEVSPTVTYTNMVPTVGQPADISKLEDQHLPYRGVTNKVGFPVVKPVSKVDAGKTYDLVVANFVRTSNDKTGMDAKVGSPWRLIIAIDAGGTVSAANLVTQISKLA